LANFRKLWVNENTGQLQQDDTNAGPVVLAPFRQYTTVPLQVVLLEPTPGDLIGTYTRLDVSNISLKVSFNDTVDDLTPLAQQTSWTKDTSNNTFQGTVALNTAAMNSYIDADTKALWMEVEWTEGGARSKPLTVAVQIRRSVTQITSTSPNPSNEYYTKSESHGVFIGRRLGPGEQMTFESQDESHERILGVDNDGNAIDFIT